MNTVQYWRKTRQLSTTIRDIVNGKLRTHAQLPHIRTRELTAKRANIGGFASLHYTLLVHPDGSWYLHVGNGLVTVLDMRSSDRGVGGIHCSASGTGRIVYVNRVSNDITLEVVNELLSRL